MFNNIGRKIKIIARVYCYLGMGLFFIAGGRYIMESSPFHSTAGFTFISFVGGLSLTIIGCLVVWLITALLYGFGELVSNSQDCHQIQETMLSLIEHKNQ